MLTVKKWDANPSESSEISTLNPERPYLRQVTETIRHNPGAEIARYGQGKPGLLFLAQGESSVPTPSFIVDEAVRAMQEGKTFYGPALGLPETRKALSDYYKNIYGLDIPASRMVLTTSGTAAVHTALQAVCDKGDEIIAVTPLWKNLLSSIQLQEGIIREVCLEEKGDRWELDLEQLFSAVTSRTRAIIINSPNNPTGWVMSESDMRTVMDFARQRGIWVLSDEVYSRMVFGRKRAPSFLDVSGPEDRLIIMSSFSKNWSLTGWRLGWLVIPEAASSQIQDIISYTYMCPPAFPQYAAIAALRHGEAFLSEQMDWYRKARDIVYDRYSSMGKIYSVKPPSTFYSFFRIEGRSDCMELARNLIDVSGLCLAPGCAFGKTGQGYLRLCFAGSEAKINDALDRLQLALGK